MLREQRDGISNPSLFMYQPSKGSLVRIAQMTITLILIQIQKIIIGNIYTSDMRKNKMRRYDRIFIFLFLPNIFVRYE